MPTFWDRTPKRRAAAALAAVLALAAPLAAKAGIVVASSGPSAASFPVGTKLPDDSKITLQTADSVTILDSRGTHVLKGAGTFTVGARGGPTRASTFAVLTRERSAQRVRTGAVRGSGPDGKPLSPNLWYVDASRSGTACVIDPTMVRLWRPDIEDEGRYLITSGADNGEKALVTFAPGSMVAAWDPQKTPVSDGATFTIAKEGSAQKGTVAFALLERKTYEPEDLAAALIAHGCQAQLELLSQSLALPSD
ncbi:hypothetical protein [Novosphingobium mangrovi (ex Huang et al. 2023)]|uniref:Uncharacterized protein n=1 Tax=Novosphingobium mangrovi (ex Huang et al. 2023) TaxID=2976432 RepID=A0ABT2I9N2_9SPHN|nr:hypothetical protein [Novosphingobium mangrovi (ex Huang et al. 2023)]MCT2401496.1 hypothetical protein [Novosphingobium mangrovi (ex Huang et al. 2023)]